jgi:hypothetical protein
VKTFLTLAAAVAACGCGKTTRVLHTWPDGSRTEVEDKRFNMQTEGSFEFEQTTNGAKRVRAGVRSGADPVARKVIEFGTELLKAAP